MLDGLRVIATQRSDPASYCLARCCVHNVCGVHFRDRFFEPPLRLVDPTKLEQRQNEVERGSREETVIAETSEPLGTLGEQHRDGFPNLPSGGRRGQRGAAGPAEAEPVRVLLTALGADDGTETTVGPQTLCSSDITLTLDRHHNDVIMPLWRQHSSSRGCRRICASWPRSAATSSFTQLAV
jgi:hypothetical protein